MVKNENEHTRRPRYHRSKKMNPVIGTFHPKRTGDTLEVPHRTVQTTVQEGPDDPDDRLEGVDLDPGGTAVNRIQTAGTEI